MTRGSCHSYKFAINYCSWGETENKNMLFRSLGLAACSSLLLACSGGSSETPPAITKAEAFRFLNQATFGATAAEAQDLMAIGYEEWLKRQIEMPPTVHEPVLSAMPHPTLTALRQRERVDIWFQRAMQAPDQLRQRVAFALSEILVISQTGALDQMPYGLASYYDQLVYHAFGDFRQLIRMATTHPAMGVYLSMLGNQKPNDALRIRPDENYARELMQLFTIGLVQLELDGTPKLDAAGKPIPTYTQATVEGFAHVYTGWSYKGVRSFPNAIPTDFNQILPMQLYPEFHDMGPKQLLATTLPGGQSGEQELELALDDIFNHPNVGPFIARRLIERLTTSNPTPAYIRRVAQKFNDNGFGKRGDLGAVVKAILLDPEVRSPPSPGPTGKLKEPLLRLTQFWRAYNARSATGSFGSTRAHLSIGQGPLQAPSVFNFFSPFYAPTGEFRASALVAPEFEIATEFLNTETTNVFYTFCFGFNSQTPGLKPDDVYIDINPEVEIATDAAALIDMVDGRLLGGSMSTTLRNELGRLLSEIPPDDRINRAASAIFIVASSPEFAVQR
jgi:uncharacterized protein (DUF1800 family)